VVVMMTLTHGEQRRGIPQLTSLTTALKILSSHATLVPSSSFSSFLSSPDVFSTPHKHMVHELSHGSQNSSMKEIGIMGEGSEREGVIPHLPLP
jgi:hypothetical protein